MIRYGILEVKPIAVGPVDDCSVVLWISGYENIKEAEKDREFFLTQNTKLNPQNLQVFQYST